MDLPRLHRAVLSSDLQAVLREISSGSDIDARTVDDGRTALHLACAFEDLSILRALLDGGADPNAADKSGLTPLHIAVYGRRWTIVGELARHRANPNAVDGRRTTPLTLAVSFDRTPDARGVRALLQAGGDPDFAPTGSTSARDRVRALAEGIGTEFPAYKVIMGSHP